MHRRCCSPGAWAPRSGAFTMTHGSTKCSCRWSTYSQTRSSRRAADRDVVEDRQVLDVLAQPDAAGVRAHRHAELRGHQDHRRAPRSRRPCGRSRPGTKRIASRLQELLEDHAVLADLAGGDARSARSPGRCARGPARRPGSSAPRSTRDRSAPAPSSAGWPRPRPSTGWRPSSACARGPISSRMSAARRMLSSRFWPTFILKCGPALRRRPPRQRRRTFSSE